MKIAYKFICFSPGILYFQHLTTMATRFDNVVTNYRTSVCAISKCCWSFQIFHQILGTRHSSLWLHKQWSSDMQSWSWRKNNSRRHLQGKNKLWLQCYAWRTIHDKREEMSCVRYSFLWGQSFIRTSVAGYCRKSPQQYKETGAVFWLWLWEDALWLDNRY